MDGHLVSRSLQEEVANPLWPCGNRSLTYHWGYELSLRDYKNTISSRHTAWCYWNWLSFLPNRDILHSIDTWSGCQATRRLYWSKMGRWIFPTVKRRRRPSGKCGAALFTRSQRIVKSSLSCRSLKGRKVTVLATLIIRSQISLFLSNLMIIIIHTKDLLYNVTTISWGKKTRKAPSCENHVSSGSRWCPKAYPFKPNTFIKCDSRISSI